MELEDIIQKDLSYRGGSIRVTDSDEMPIFGEPIYHYQNDDFPFLTLVVHL